MSAYRLHSIKFKRKKYIEKQPPKIQSRIWKAINCLLQNPRSHPYKSGGIKHLKKGKYHCTWQSKEIFRFRIAYKIDEENKTIKITKLLPHLDSQR